MMDKTFIRLSVALTLFMQHAPSVAYDINEQLSIGGLLAVANQCQNISDAPGYSDACEWAAPFQPRLSYRPTQVDEMFFKLGFAKGNGLNDVSPFVIAPWAATLEDDVKNINGRSRDHLLTAWYKHIFNFGNKNSLSTTIGIIDSTDYLDNNAYANDEYTQFMNSALTNGPNVFLPSYDLGLALVFDTGPWSLRGVLMNIGENKDGNNTNFYGFQAGYRINNKLGTGRYRAVVAGSSEDFLNVEGTQLVKRITALLSFDQEFGKVIGGWLRFGWRNDDSASDHDAIYSGGIDIKGSTWGRSADNIGLGIAYINGGNLDIDKSNVAEAYYRWQLGEVIGTTADIQYIQDDYRTSLNPSGWIYSLRATVEF